MVLVPFETATETEQTIRARRLRDRGLAEVVWESELTPSSLARAIDATVSRRPPAADARPRRRGASARLVGGARRPAGAGGARPVTGWRALETALDAIAAARRGDPAVVARRRRRPRPPGPRAPARARRAARPAAGAGGRAAVARGAGARRRSRRAPGATVLQHGYRPRQIMRRAGGKPIELGERAVDADPGRA